MNKNIVDQLPADEQPTALKLQEAAGKMEVPAAFEWELENRLMEKYNTKYQAADPPKFAISFGWAFAAVCAVFLLSWAIRTLVPRISAGSGETTASEMSFEANVRAGNICSEPLALAHGFSAFVTNKDKSGFIELDELHITGELRSFAWSADGRLAVVGNTTGTGNIYTMDPEDHSLRPVLTDSPPGYLMDVAWSNDARQLLTWSLQDNTTIYLIDIETGMLKEFRRDAQFFSTPQFSPGDESIVFYGLGQSTGLFQSSLDGTQERLISPLVENEDGFAWAPDGLMLAYFEMRRSAGEAALLLENPDGGGRSIIASLPIPGGSGSSIPDVANLSWSQDRTRLVFEFGEGARDRAVYLASADGTELIKVADPAYAPAISADGNCLAYISNKQVFLLDLTRLSSPTTSTPVLLADLPAGRSNSDFRLDKLLWQP